MIRYEDICACLVTRGDVDMDWVKDLPYGEVKVWDNSKRPDRKVYGRYVAAEMSEKPYVYFQDDDVRFHNHDELLRVANLHPTKLVSNMYNQWIEDCAYYDLALVGLGSICPNFHWDDAFQKYQTAFPDDERFELDCDFIFGVLSRWHRGEFGHEILDIAADDTRLWRQPGQNEGKWESINNARSLREVVLTMIVRNEEENIVRALSSAEGLYDKVLIVDTGSTDKTIDVAGNWLADRHIYHSIHTKPWVNFGHNRTELMELGADMADYMLLMDADEEFTTGSMELPGDVLIGDGYMLHYAGELDYSQPRLIYRNFPWRWDGTVHAALDSDLTPVVFDLRSPLIIHHGDDRHGKNKIAADVKELTRLINESDYNEADLPRLYFLRAKACEGLGEWDQAIADYEERIMFSTGDEEAFYSRFRLGLCLIERKGDIAGGADHLMTAWLERPQRIESIRALAHYLTVIADETPYPVDDRVIVHRNLYAKTD